MAAAPSQTPPLVQRGIDAAASAVRADTSGDLSNRLPRQSTRLRSMQRHSIRRRYVRYVRVNHENKCLHMQQVEVYTSDETNVALVSRGGVASQSSTYGGALAARTIDGDTADDAPWPNAGHTQANAHEWWEVELFEPVPIVRVVVYNRPDECRERLFGAQLLVLDQGRLELASFALTADRRQEFTLDSSITTVPTVNTVGGVAHDAMPFELTAIRHQLVALERNLPRQWARYVRVDHKNECLHMQQVEVYTSDGTNVALASRGGVAFQSSTYGGALAARTIDGDTADDAPWPNAGHTQANAQEWWEVELSEPMPIVSVVVYNRPDECGERLFGAQLLVLDQDRLELSSFELTEDRRQEFALMVPWRHIDAERRLGDVPRCSPRLEQHILLAGATPNVYLMLDLCCQDPLGVFMRGLRSQTIVNGRRYEPHITLMPLRLAPHDASKLRDDDTFACEVRRLFTEHLSGATARAKGWGILGPNRYLALQFELVLRCCITEFRIGVYRALGVLLSAGGRWRLAFRVRRCDCLT